MTTEAVGPDRQYFSFLTEGKFMLQRSRRGDRPFFYPRIAEPGTGNTDLEWVEATGLGTVYATTRVRVRPPEVDYNVAVVELDDGPRMLSRVEGIAAADVAIGLRVAARIVPFEDHHVVVFTPLDAADTDGATRS